MYKTLVESFAHISSDENYSKSFKAHKLIKWRIRIWRQRDRCIKFSIENTTVSVVGEYNPHMGGVDFLMAHANFISLFLHHDANACILNKKVAEYKGLSSHRLLLESSWSR